MPKIPELDGVRAIAVMAVLLFHTGVAQARGGALGVDMFFVLSGFLITSIAVAELDRTGGLDLPRFFERRARRLLPALLVLLAVYLLFAGQISATHADRRFVDAGLAGLYLMNLAEAYSPHFGPLSHTWSLAVEAHFYLVWPFVLLRLHRLGRPRASLIMLGLWAAITLARFAWDVSGAPGRVAYFSTPFHASGLALGAAAALAPFRPKRGGWAGLAAFAALATGPKQLEGAAIPLAELASAAVVLAPPSMLGWRPLAALGAISYGVYLWHIPIHHALGQPRGWTAAGLVGILTVGAATVSYLGIERRFLRRARPRPAPQAATA